MSSPRWRSYRWRLALYALLMLGASWFIAPHPWWPTSTHRTAHFVIDTTATPAQAALTGDVLEALYRGYHRRFVGTDGSPHVGPLRVRLHATLDELRTVNPGMGWRMSFYEGHLSHSFYDAGWSNATHWVAHEVGHQLAEEVSHYKPEQWLDEGLASYVATSPAGDDSGSFATIDWTSYPARRVRMMATAPDLATSVQNGSIIPLRAIVTGAGGPPVEERPVLYYLHWWTLTRFLLEHPRHRQVTTELLRSGGHLADVERLCGPLDEVEREWFAYVRSLRERRLDADR